MTQRSWPWPGTTVGDAGPYSADEWDDMFEMRFGSGAGADYYNRGVIRNWANELEVTDPVVANRVVVDTGAALVHGKHYDNDVAVNVSVASSVGAWREDLICLRAVWALQYVQIARYSNPADGVAYPAPTQTDGVTWEIPLAAVRIDAGGVILQITDLRESAYNRMMGAPAARVYHNADQNVANAPVWTTLAFNSEDFDTDALHDVAVNNSRLTCTIPGKYQISSCIRFQPNAVGLRFIRLRANGVQIIGANCILNVGAADSTILSLTTLVHLAAGDYVEVRAYQASGGPLNVMYGGDYSPYFEMVRVAD